MDFLCLDDKPDLVVQAVLDELVDTVIRERELTIDLTHLTAIEILQKLDDEFDMEQAFKELEEPAPKTHIEIDSCPIYFEDGAEMVVIDETPTNILLSPKEIQLTPAEPPNAIQQIVRRMPLQNKKTVIAQDLEKIEENVLKIPMITKQRPRLRKQLLEPREDMQVSFKTPVKTKRITKKPRKPRTKKSAPVFDSLSDEESAHDEVWDAVKTEDDSGVKSETESGENFDNILSILEMKSNDKKPELPQPVKVGNSSQENSMDLLTFINNIELQISKIVDEDVEKCDKKRNLTDLGEPAKKKKTTRKSVRLEITNQKMC